MFVVLLGISIAASLYVAIGNRFRNPVLDGFTVVAPVFYILLLIVYRGFDGIIVNVIGGIALFGSPIILLFTSLIRHFRELDGALLIVANFVAFIAAIWISFKLFFALSAVSV